MKISTAIYLETLIVNTGIECVSVSFINLEVLIKKNSLVKI